MNKLMYHIDQPSNFFQRTTSGQIVIRGWCLNRNFEPSTKICIRFGDRVIYCQAEERKDILSRFGLESFNPLVGFYAEFKVGGGLKLLHIQAKFSDHEIHSIGKRLIYHKKRKEQTNYKDWIKEFDHTKSQANVNVEKRIESFNHKPVFSVILPVYDASSKFLRETIESVQKQSYKNWQLCISIRSSDMKSLKFLHDLENQDSRILLQLVSGTANNSCLINAALARATGDFYTFLDQDDLFAKNGFAWIVERLNRNLDLEIIYSDEDRIDKFGNRHDPYFKSDWNTDLLLSTNYFSRMTVIRKDIGEDLKGFREGLDTYQDWDYFLRAVEKSDPKNICHIPKILYHVRTEFDKRPNSIIEEGKASRSRNKILSDYLNRNNLDGEIVQDILPFARIKYSLPKNLPKISIIIPTRDQVEMLKICIDGIVRKTAYSNYAITIVDNNSEHEETLQYFEAKKAEGIHILSAPGSFNFSRLTNMGVTASLGDIVLLLNNDIEVINSSWLEEMVRHVLRPEIGVVGAKLLYPTRKIQHAGVILGLGGVAGHPFRHYDGDATGPRQRLKWVQNYSAVTGACMMFKRSIYEEVGGFEERQLPVAYNDIDFCLRVLQKGYRILFTPAAELIHHESYSRGADDTYEKQMRFRKEVHYMQKRWGKLLENDPAYNPNLTKLKEDFGLGIPSYL